jgi:phosphoglucomutase
MAFNSILSAAIQVGKAIKKELWDTVKDNFDDHESRLNLIETNTQKVPVFEFLVLNSASFQTATGLNYFEATTSFTLTEAYIRIFEVGSLTGDFEIDIKKSTTDLDSGSFVSVFTTKPKVDLDTASDYDASTNQVFDNGQITISPGDYLRLDITQYPTSGVMGKFIVKVYGEAS